MPTCFVYGTLMAEEVLARVVFGSKTIENTPVRSMAATLYGHKRYRLLERDYPGVVKSVDTDQVEGRLIFNLDNDAIKKLDVFEGTEYSREVITAIGEDGNTYDASIYIFLDTHLLDKDAGEWRFDEFQLLKMRNWIADELGDTDGLGGRFWDSEQVKVIS